MFIAGAVVLATAGAGELGFVGHPSLYRLGAVNALKFADAHRHTLQAVDEECKQSLSVNGYLPHLKSMLLGLSWVIMQKSKSHIFHHTCAEVVCKNHRGNAQWLFFRWNHLLWFKSDQATGKLRLFLRNLWLILGWIGGESIHFSRQASIHELIGGSLNTI